MKRVILLSLIAIPIFGSEPVQSDVQDVQKEKIEHIKKLLRANEVLIEKSTQAIKTNNVLVSTSSVIQGFCVVPPVGSMIVVAYRTFGALSQGTLSVNHVAGIGVSLFLGWFGKVGWDIGCEVKEKLNNYQKGFANIKSAAIQSLEQQNTYLENPSQQVDLKVLQNMKHVGDYKALVNSMEPELRGYF
jgi:hypothetical protein